MLLTVKDLSAWLNLKPSTLYLWAAQGKIPCRKIHGLVRFDATEIDRWLSSFSPPQSVPSQIGNRIAVEARNGKAVWLSVPAAGFVLYE